MANERLDRFTKLLKEIFELDKSDLDFGIYRVMNLRKTQIEEFLTQRLPQMVQETLVPFAQGSKEEIRAQMTQIEESVAGMGMTVDALPDTAPMKQKYFALQKTLAEGADLSALETDVYSALYSFFNRYYEDGDFISKRRYKEGVYAIPYEGEEVKLYWANQDQYYIKTSENFKDYTFVFDGITVHFRLVDATTEQNNNKENKDTKRTFMLFTEDEDNYPGIKTFEYDAESHEMVIRFIFDVQTKYTGKSDSIEKKWQEDNFDAIQKWILQLRDAELIVLLAPIPTGKGKETTTLLEKHLKGYVAKNTFDYFIHKDLRGFLTRELDFFIKSEVMHLEDLDTGSEARVETYLAKLKAIKRVGKIIIDFLAQIEDFQKKLWQKKKFVVETNWCITLDKIDESFWSEISANKAQIEEWIAMYAIDETEGWSNPPTVDFLRQNLNLIVDTAHFPNTFKLALIESIPDLDDQTNGVLLNGDNYHALNLLQSKYRNKIKSMYIDPPYNAQSSEIMYKNTFKHSAWLSLMENRLQLSEALLTDNGVGVIAIDEVEQTRLGELLKSIAPHKNCVAISVVHNPSGQQGDNFSFTNEFAYFVYPEQKEIIGLEDRPEDEWDTRTFRDNSGNNNLRTDAANCFYPIFVKDGLIVGFGDVCPDEYHPEMRNIQLSDGVIAVYPIDNNGVEKKWVFERGTVEGILDELWVKETTNPDGIDIMRTKKRFRHKTTWTDKKYSANSYGSSLLTAMSVPFTYPKSIFNVQECVEAALSDKKYGTVIDYFAGSGTTAHAVMNSNWRDQGTRKYILVEMGEYFENATKLRVKKAAYAVDTKAWKKGKPQNRRCGVSQIIKYMRIESYEDALSNIELSDDGGQLAALLGEEYLIHYMVDLESRGSLLDVEAFLNPFAYTMKVTEKNECKERGVDLCETFNYLIGLTVTSQSAISYFISKPAETPAYEGAVDLLSDINGQYAFRQIEGALPDGRRALVIWRTVTDDVIASNAALDAYFTTYRKNAQERKYDVIFVNGDSNLENLRGSSEGWKVQVTEVEFKKRMFEEV